MTFYYKYANIHIEFKRKVVKYTMTKTVVLTEEQLKTIQQAMLFVHKELSRDILSQDEETLKDLEGTMEVLGLKEKEDFNSLLPEYNRLFP